MYELLWYPGTGSIGNVPLGDGEKVQWVICLLGNQEDLRQDSQHQCQTLDMMVSFYNPALRMQRQADPRGLWLVTPAEIANNRPSNKLCLTK